MNSLPLISVIIPVYNNEKYIESAVRSLLQQSYQKLEIIVVNDGSKDRTREILESKFSSIPNIIIINKENAGVSAARNDGIRAAHGEYIAFLDSDDEYLPDAFENMVSLIDENIDFLVCSHIKHWIKNHPTINENKVLTKQNVCSDFMNLSSVFNFIWANLYRRDIIIANQIYFNEATKFSEDFEFNLNYIKHISKQIKISSKPIYLYYISRSGAHEKRDYPAKDIKVIVDFFGGKENMPEKYYHNIVNKYLVRCVNRNVSWYRIERAAQYIKQAFAECAEYIDEYTLCSAFGDEQAKLLKNDDYELFVKNYNKTHKRIIIEKYRYRLSKTAVKILNALKLN